MGLEQKTRVPEEKWIMPSSSSAMFKLRGLRDFHVGMRLGLWG